MNFFEMMEIPVLGNTIGAWLLALLILLLLTGVLTLVRNFTARWISRIETEKRGQITTLLSDIIGPHQADRAAADRPVRRISFSGAARNGDGHHLRHRLYCRIYSNRHLGQLFRCQQPQAVYGPQDGGTSHEFRHSGHEPDRENDPLVRCPPYHIGQSRGQHHRP
jgi:hypothetical protein